MECIYFILSNYRKKGDMVWMLAGLIHEVYCDSWCLFVSLSFVSSYLLCSFLDMYGSTCVKHILWDWFLSKLYCVKVSDFETLNISEHLIFCRGHDSQGSNSVCHSRSWARAAIQKHTWSFYGYRGWWIPNQITVLKKSVKSPFSTVSKVLVNKREYIEGPFI